MSRLTDANGQRFWLLAGDLAPEAPHEAWAGAHWAQSSASNVDYESAHRSLRLTSLRNQDHVAEEAEARASLALPIQSVDTYGTRSYWASDRDALVADGAISGLDPATIVETTRPDDLTAGHDRLLYLAVEEKLLVGRLADLVALEVDDRPWPHETLPRAGVEFEVHRVAPRPGAGAWVLDVLSRQLARVDPDPTELLPLALRTEPVIGRCERAPKVALAIQPNAVLPAEEEAVDLDAHPGSGAATVLTWDADGQAFVRVLEEESGEWGSPVLLQGVRFPHSLRWLDDGHVAVLLRPGWTLEGSTGEERDDPEELHEAPVFPLPVYGDVSRPVGDRYPLRDHDGARFARVLGGAPAYGQVDGALKRLYPLSLPSFARSGSVRNVALPGEDEVLDGRVVDSADARTEWHRAVVECVLPPGCGLRLWLAAGRSPAPELEELEEETELEWFPHDFGDVPPTGFPIHPPRGHWIAEPNELPFHRGLVPCERERDRAGAFQVLVQRSWKRTRTLRGRYLFAQFDLFGTGLRTPEVFGLRVWGSRFSYVREYLPELYHERVFGTAAEAGTSTDPEAPTQHDFLERFVATFESLLTPLEDKVASACAVTDVHATPDESLAWLGSWIGVGFDGRWDGPARRRVLDSAPERFSWRGTREGVEQMLEALMPGIVASGTVVILEGWQLRRTFSTILGADLANEDDPLIGAVSVSGNSYVGDTLFLGDEEQKEFLALFSADLDLTEEEEETVAAFFDDFAFRILVAVNDELDTDTRTVIRTVVEREAPAHIAVDVAPVSQRLRVGLASLVGIDTRTAAVPEPERVRVDVSALGHGDRVGRPASFDPRLMEDVR